MNKPILFILLLWIILLCSCASSSNYTSSLSPGLTSEPAEFYPESVRILAKSTAAETAEDDDASEEQDPFEEDPFEEEEDPFAQEDASDQQSISAIPDPLAGWNRIVFKFNDKLYFWVLKPVAKGYRFITPTPIRLGIKNFFVNLLGPLRFVNCALQGKGEAADAELVRFVMNSTVGVLGFGNPAKNYPELAIHHEDFGQTFGHWGLGHGFYIVWPVLGPSSLRDSLGLIGDYALDPITYIESYELAFGVWGFGKVNDTSFRIGDYESVKGAALDPYEAFRNIYFQYRRSQVAK